MQDQILKINGFVYDPIRDRYFKLDKKPNTSPEHSKKQTTHHSNLKTHHSNLNLLSSNCNLLKSLFNYERKLISPVNNLPVLTFVNKILDFKQISYDYSKFLTEIDFHPIFGSIIMEPLRLSLINLNKFIDASFLNGSPRLVKWSCHLDKPSLNLVLNNKTCVNVKINVESESRPISYVDKFDLSKNEFIRSINNENHETLIIGCDFGLYERIYNSHRTIKLASSKSPIVSICRSKLSNSIIYCGFRNGEIALLDLRSKVNDISQYSVGDKLCKIDQCIDHIYNLSNGFTILVQDITGSYISMFDTRVGKSIEKINLCATKGHKKLSLPRSRRFFVIPDTNLLVASKSDSLGLMIWDINSSKLSKTINFSINYLQDGYVQFPSSNFTNLNSLFNKLSLLTHSYDSKQSIIYETFVS